MNKVSLKFDIQCKISAWRKNLNARNAGATKFGKLTIRAENSNISAK